MNEQTGLLLPPKDLIYRVAGTSDPDWFVQSGLQSVKDIESALQSVGRTFAEHNSVLDFGCGCGRIMLQLGEVMPLNNVTGVDIDFCRKRLVESVKTESFLPLILKCNSVEDPMRPTAALLARALFARALDTKLDITTFAKAVIAAAYAEMAGTSAATVREDVELVVDHLLFEIRMESESQSRRGTSSKP